MAATATNGHATTLSVHGDRANALTLCEQALAEFRDIDDQENAAHTLHYIGVSTLHRRYTLTLKSSRPR